MSLSFSPAESSAAPSAAPGLSPDVLLTIQALEQLTQAVVDVASRQETLMAEMRVRLASVEERLAKHRDIDAERQRQALESTARFVDAHLAHLTGIGGTYAESKDEILRRAVLAAPAEGLALEFGVATGATLRQIVALRGTAHGFDSFEGLPEHWRSGFGAGRFAQTPPEVPGSELHVGWFEDSLPRFLAEHPEPWAFVHLDADLYSSTKTVFDLAFDRFRPGTVLLFDEYFNYPGWEQHEHKAFVEFLDRYDGGFDYIEYSSVFEQVAVRLT